MLKYVNTSIVFQEIPDETTLAINISGCPCRCPGCHSSYLWQNIGTPLSTDVLDHLLQTYRHHITCICFMGGDGDPSALFVLVQYLRKHHPWVKIGWYSGRTVPPLGVDIRLLHYLKLGPYLRHLGALTSPTTNQRLYRIEADGTQTNLTPRLTKHLKTTV